MSALLKNAYLMFKSEVKRLVPGSWNPIAVREAHALFTYLLTLPIAVFWFTRMISDCPLTYYFFFTRIIKYIYLFLFLSAIAIMRLGIGVLMRGQQLNPGQVIDYIDDDTTGAVTIRETISATKQAVTGATKKAGELQKKLLTPED